MVKKAKAEVSLPPDHFISEGIEHKVVSECCRVSFEAVVDFPSIQMKCNKCGETCNAKQVLAD